MATHAVYGIACWDPDVLNSGIESGQPCGGTFDQATVKNGTIVQGQSAAAFSYPLRFGQGGGTGLTVTSLNLTWGSSSTDGILVTTTNGGASVYGNIFNNQVTVVQNRMALQANSVKIINEATCTAPNLIHDNVVNGGPQGGIITDCQGSKLYNNVVSMNTIYTNGFGVWNYGNNQELYGNQITCGGPSSANATNTCRGIHSENNSGGNIHNNSIYVRDSNQNVEYSTSNGGCELSGAFGWQLEAGSNNTATSNNVTAYADVCDGNALRVTDPSSPSPSSLSGNSWTAVRRGNTAFRAAGVSLYGAQNVTITGDTFTADSYPVAVDWPGVCNVLFQGDTFNRGANAASSFTFIYDEPGSTDPVCNGLNTLEFRDSIFGQGVDPNTNTMQPINYSGWQQATEYKVTWTYVLTLTNGSSPLAGATVLIKNALGGTDFSGTTNSSGQIATVLTQFRRYNTASSGNAVDQHNPHVVSVSMPGCTTVNYNLNVSSTTNDLQTMTCQQ